MKALTPPTVLETTLETYTVTLFLIEESDIGRPLSDNIGFDLPCWYIKDQDVGRMIELSTAEDYRGWFFCDNLPEWAEKTIKGDIND